MTQPTPIRGDLSCTACGGSGYVVRRGAAWAEAVVCSCVPECDLCGGSGRRYVEGKEGVRVGRCRCRILPDRVELFNQARIPARHAGSSFETFRTDRNPAARHVHEWCVNWTDGYRPDQENCGVILSGGVGRGKTHLMVAMLRRLVMDRGVAVRFVEFSHLLSALKAGFDEGVGEATTLKPLVEVPVLALDELGKGRASEWELTIADALVSHRYNALATTLGTTNYRPISPTGLVETNLSRPDLEPSLGDRVGGRVFSRLKEMCQFLVVGGEDYRTRSAW